MSYLLLRKVKRQGEDKQIEKLKVIGTVLCNKMWKKLYTVQ